jgi:hypothetical protein
MSIPEIIITVVLGLLCLAVIYGAVAAWVASRRKSNE